MLNLLLLHKNIKKTYFVSKKVKTLRKKRLKKCVLKHNAKTDVEFSHV